MIPPHHRSCYTFWWDGDSDGLPSIGPGPGSLGVGKRSLCSAGKSSTLDGLLADGAAVVDSENCVVIADVVGVGMMAVEGPGSVLGGLGTAGGRGSSVWSREMACLSRRSWTLVEVE